MGLNLLLLTAEPEPADVLPPLDLLPHSVRVLTPDATALLSAGPRDAILVDARADLVAAKSLCKLLAAASVDAPVVAVVTEGGLVAVTGEWGVDEILLPTAGPAEVDARLRLLAARTSAPVQESALRLGDLVIDEHTYTARLRGRALELTYKEFELLKHLAAHAGRVFTRAQLLQEVWGYDFFGGTRTVDVHVRRLRAKLGPEHEQMIGTVRNVGYKFVRPQRGTSQRRAREADQQAQEAEQHAQEVDAAAPPAIGVPRTASGAPT